jgi:hypothetical protein
VFCDGGKIVGCLVEMGLCLPSPLMLCVKEKLDVFTSPNEMHKIFLDVMYLFTLE